MQVHTILNEIHFQESESQACLYAISYFNVDLVTDIKFPKLVTKRTQHRYGLVAFQSFVQQ